MNLKLLLTSVFAAAALFAMAGQASASTASFAAPSVGVVSYDAGVIKVAEYDDEDYDDEDYDDEDWCDYDEWDCDWDYDGEFEVEIVL
jgi:hypothetical protein